MNTKSIWVVLRTIAMIVGIVLFFLGLVQENAQFYWLGAFLFMVGFAALGYASMSEQSEHHEAGSHRG